MSDNSSPQASENTLSTLVVEGLILAFGLFFLVNILMELRVRPADQPVNYATFPAIVSACIVLLMLIKITGTLLGFTRERAQAAEHPTGATRPGLWTSMVHYTRDHRLEIFRIISTVALALLYTWLLQQVHFFILTLIFLIIMFVLYGRRRLLPVALFSLFCAGSIYGIFIGFLNLPL